MLSFCNTLGPYRWVLFGLNPIRDPEMPIFTEQPKEFSNAKLIRKRYGDYFIETGEENCRLCLMSAKDYGKRYYNVYEGMNSLDIKSKGLDCVLTMCKPGFIPLSFDIIRLYNCITVGDISVKADLVEVGCFDNTMISDKFIVDQGKTTIKAKTVVLGPGTEVKIGASLVVTPFTFSKN